MADVLGDTVVGNKVVVGVITLNKDSKTEALFDNRSMIKFMSIPQPKD